MTATSTASPRDGTRRAFSALRFRSVLIAVMAIVIVMAAVVPLIVSQHSINEMRRTQVEQQFKLISSGVRSRFQAQVGSADAVLDTLSVSFPALVADEESAVMLARVLGDLRRVSPVALAAYYAKDDGSFALARAMTQEDRAKAEKAGFGQGVFEVQVGSPRDGNREDTYTYLDESYRVLGRVGPLAVDYDSRQRPWYKLAMAADRAIVTPPYRFQDYPLSGLTLSRRGGTDGRDVFAIDVTLDDLSTTLRNGLAFAGEQISIIEGDGWLVADSAAHPLPIKLGQPGDPQRGRLMPETDKPDGVLRAYRFDPSPRDLDLDSGGSRILATFATFRFANQDFLIASTLPYDVLDEPVMRSTRWFLAVECAIALLALLVGLWAAGAISGPIMALASDVENIVAFRVRRSFHQGSRLIEVRRLSEAIDTLELTLKAFATYTPPLLVRGIVARGQIPEIGGNRRVVVVMFSDIEGFTAIAEDLAPADLMSQLSRHLAAIAEEVISAGGTVDKFIGDSVMAFWDGENAAALACRAVLTAIARVERLNTDFAAEGLPSMRSRFGLHKGEAMVGNVGTLGRMSYTVLGHTVNVASRIEALNKVHGTTILVSSAIADAAGRGFTFKHVANEIVRGSKTSIGLYTIPL